MRQLLLAVFILITLLFMLGCASPEVKILEDRQRDIRDCILSGGHPHAGPNDTTICL